MERYKGFVDDGGYCGSMVLSLGSSFVLVGFALGSFAFFNCARKAADSTVVMDCLWPFKSVVLDDMFQ